MQRDITARDYFYASVAPEMLHEISCLKPTAHGVFLSAGLLACSCAGNLADLVLLEIAQSASHSTGFS